MDNMGGGSMPTGKWVNKYNGQEIYVRDTINDGNHMLIITDIGQLTMNEFSDYIQLEEGEVIPTLNDLYGSKINNLQAAINQGLPTEDRINLNNEPKPSILKNEITQTNFNKETKSQNKPQPKKEYNKNYDLIKKVFDKFPIDRSIEFSIIEEQWPFKEFNMLVNILDVPIEDICSYIIDNYLNKDKLVESLTEYIKDIIDKNMFNS